jgi:hypothetical protein
LRVDSTLYLGARSAKDDREGRKLKISGAVVTGLGRSGV